MPKKSKRLAAQQRAAAQSPEQPPYKGMSFPGRLALVAAFHVVALLGIWWALTPSPTSHHAYPDHVPLWLSGPALIFFALLLLQVSARLPKLLVGVAFVLAAFGQALSVVGINAVAEHTRMSPAVATVVSQEVLFNFTRRLHIELDGKETIAYSELTVRQPNPKRYGRRYVSFRPGDRVNVLVDPSGTFFTRVTNGVGSDFSPPVAWLHAVFTLLAWVATELICFSALARRTSLMMAVDSRHKKRKKKTQAEVTMEGDA